MRLLFSSQRKEETEVLNELLEQAGIASELRDISHKTKSGGATCQSEVGVLNDNDYQEACAVRDGMDEPVPSDCQCPFCHYKASFPSDECGSVQLCPNCLRGIVIPADGSSLAKALPLPILTPRLTMRLIRGTDENDLLKVLGDDSLHDFMYSLPWSEDETRTYVETALKAQIGNPDDYIPLVAETRDKGEFIGYLWFYYLPAESRGAENRQGSFGLIVKRDCWRMGYGREMVLGILKFGFLGIGLHDIRVGVDSRNVAACNLYASVGMRREGEFYEYKLVNEGWINTVWYAMLARELPK